MPKKTKQEKIIAELRRELETKQDMKLENGSLITKKYTVSLPSQVSNIQLQHPTSTFQSPTSTLYIKKDLLKTLLLSLFALSFELVIYWAWSH